MPRQHASGSLIETSRRLCESLPDSDRKTFLASVSDLVGTPNAARALAVPIGIQRAMAAGSDLADAIRHARAGQVHAT